MVKWLNYIYICIYIFFCILFHYRSSLCYTVGTCRLSILYRMYVYVNPKLLNSLMVKKSLWLQVTCNFLSNSLKQKFKYFEGIPHYILENFSIENPYFDVLCREWSIFQGIHFKRYFSEGAEWIAELGTSEFKSQFYLL